MKIRASACRWPGRSAGGQIISNGTLTVVGVGTNAGSTIAGDLIETPAATVGGRTFAIVAGVADSALSQVRDVDGYTLRRDGNTLAVQPWIPDNLLLMRYDLWRTQATAGLGLLDGDGYWFDSATGGVTSPPVGDVLLAFPDWRGGGVTNVDGKPYGWQVADWNLIFAWEFQHCTNAL